MRVIRNIMLGLLLGGTLATPAWATLDNHKSFKQAYPDMKAVSCKTCHNAAVGKKGDLNAYGAALQKLKGEGNAKKLTVEDYRAIEQDDADGDGASNADELKGGKHPGDPKAGLPDELLRDALAELMIPSAWAEGEPASG